MVTTTIWGKSAELYHSRGVCVFGGGRGHRVLCLGKGPTIHEMCRFQDSLVIGEFRFSYYIYVLSICHYTTRGWKRRVFVAIQYIQKSNIGCRGIMVTRSLRVDLQAYVWVMFKNQAIFLLVVGFFMDPKSLH